jgi:hypothetical protein
MVWLPKQETNIMPAAAGAVTVKLLNTFTPVIVFVPALVPVKETL